MQYILTGHGASILERNASLYLFQIQRYVRYEQS